VTCGMCAGKCEECGGSLTRVGKTWYACLNIECMLDEAMAPDWCEDCTSDRKIALVRIYNWPQPVEDDKL
jgi:hypothetical protein